jgi:hypothetical protein
MGYILKDSRGYPKQDPLLEDVSRAIDYYDRARYWADTCEEKRARYNYGCILREKMHRLVTGMTQAEAWRQYTNARKQYRRMDR